MICSPTFSIAFALLRFDMCCFWFPIVFVMCCYNLLLFVMNCFALLCFPIVFAMFCYYLLCFAACSYSFCCVLLCFPMFSFHLISSLVSSASHLVSRRGGAGRPLRRPLRRHVRRPPQGTCMHHTNRVHAPHRVRPCLFGPCLSRPCLFGPCLSNYVCVCISVTDIRDPVTDSP